MFRFLTTILTAGLTAVATPPNLVVDGIPAIPDALREQARPYLQLGMVRFHGWHPSKREMLITMPSFHTTEQE